MVTIVRQGRCRSAEAADLERIFGPNGQVATTNRREPGYLGSLLLVGARELSPDELQFILVEMWDERYASVGRFLAPPESAVAVDWDRPGTVLRAVR
jgi:hypothetical protein